MGGVYLGSKEWLQRVRDRVDAEPRSHEHARVHRDVVRASMDEIVLAVATTTGVPEQSIQWERGGAPRMIAAWLGGNEAMLTNSEIASALHLGSAARVTQLIAACEHERRTSATLRSMIDHCITTLGRKT